MSVVGGNMDKVEINSYEDLFNVLDSIDDIDTKERELSAFVKLRNFMPDVKCLLITNSEEMRTEYNGISIEVLPAWKWLLRK